jgi:glycosidase
MHDVLRFWLDRGVDGFRVDAPHRLGKDGLLRDNPPDVVDLRVATQVDDRRHRNLDDPFVHHILRELRTVTDSYPDTVLVGEVRIHHRARRLRYYESGDELQLAFDFGFWAKSVGCAGVPRERARAGHPDGRMADALNHDIPEGKRFWSCGRDRNTRVEPSTSPCSAASHSDGRCPCQAAFFGTSERVDNPSRCVDQ